jgi:Zn-dependent protease with chaperone function
MKFVTRSLVILIALYGLVFVLGDIYLARSQAPLWGGVIFAAAFIGLQFLAGPYVISWLLDIMWIDSTHAAERSFSRIPEASFQFLERLCAERGLKMPRIGVIESGTPNAFTFGHVPRNARLVITSGLVDVLTVDELNAVLAHEVGHIEHWDFAVMAVAALVPLLLYQVYVGSRYNSNTRLVAIGAYACYFVSQFVVLLLNRTREYFADQYSAQVTRRPDELSSALVKIATGLLKAEGQYEKVLTEGSDDAKKQARRQHRLSGTMAIMGISHVRAAGALTLGGSDPAAAARVMRWDLVNPWARFYQLSSTHPLTALRVRELNREAAVMYQVPKYQLLEHERVSWATFPIQVVLWAAPLLTGGALLFNWLLLTDRHTRAWSMPARWTPWLLIATGLFWMLRVLYRYHGQFEPATVAGLLDDVQVSEMRPRAVRLEGEILGRGQPGAFWSPDLVLRDSTGMLFVLYRQSIPLMRFLFAITAAQDYVGHRVVIDGWYRRGLRPYVEMSRISIPDDGITHRGYSRWVQLAIAAAGVLIGYAWLS